jgi:hypothetical protein
MSTSQDVYVAATGYDLLRFTEAQSLWGYGQNIGHLGAGDQFAGLKYLGGR